MNSIKGQIQIKGKPVAGLKVLISAGSEDQKAGTFNSKPLVEFVTDSKGNFTNEKKLSEFPGKYSESKTTYIVTVFNGDEQVYVTTYNLFPSQLEVDFDMDLEMSADGPDERSRLTGYITTCNRPASGLTVRAFATRQFGIEIDGRCRPGNTSVRSLGSVEVESDGTYSIRFTPTTIIQGTCFFRRQVYIEVYDGDSRVWRSQPINENSSNEINGEVYSGCTEDSTLIRVLNENGGRAANAEVYVNGIYKGRTDNNGQLPVPNVRLGSKVAARLMVKENSTGRGNHKHESDQNWNYRVYQTSIIVLHDANGDNVVLPQHMVSAPEEVQIVRLRSNNALIGFNLLISIEWDATAEELLYYSDRLKEVSELLYNATDGQFVIEHFVIADDKQSWNDADIRVHGSLKQSSNANAEGFFHTGQYINMNPRDAFIPGAWLHEMGHYLFGMRDEYTDNRICTEATLSTIGPAEFFDGGVKDSCLMRGPNFVSSMKFCSNHPDNPHVRGNEQGDNPCWNNIMNCFNGSPLWRLHSPETRNAIVTKFPDSGVNMMLLTIAPDLIQVPVQSHIPVQGWKPRYHFDNEHREQECKQLKVTVFYNGVPVNDARITLNTPQRSIYMGWSGPRPYLNIRNPETNETTSFFTIDGECIIRGAHEGDTITVYKEIENNNWLLGTTTIYAHGAGMNLYINTERMSFGIGELPEVFPTSINEFSISNITEKDVKALTGNSYGNDVSWNLDITPSEYYFNRKKSLFNIYTENINHINLYKSVQVNDQLNFQLPVNVSLVKVLENNEHTLFSPDGCMKIIFRKDSLDLPDQIVITELTKSPKEFNDGIQLVAGPYSVKSLKNKKCHVDASVQFFISYTNIIHSENFEVLQYHKETSEWIKIESTSLEFPVCTFFNLTQFGIYALVESNKKNK